ncbi:hypothetical protein, partial [Citrobacter amalonaticus]
MFSYLKAMYHQSKIQAELKAQIHEQTTVNAICHHPESIEIIAVCSTDAYYRKRKDAAFLTTCSVRHCCKVSDEAAFCLIQRPYISKTLLT